MPDLAPNLDLDGARRVTLDEVARELVDQWSRTCVLLCDLVCVFPPSVLSGTAVDLPAKAEDAACKALCILSALANYVVRAIVSRSELTPDAEVVEVAVSDSQGSGGDGAGAAGSAARGRGGAAGGVALPVAVDTAGARAGGDGGACEPDACRGDVAHRTGGTRAGVDCATARGGLECSRGGHGELCAAAVREVAAETRRIAKDARAAGAGGAKRVRSELRHRARRPRTSRRREEAQSTSSDSSSHAQTIPRHTFARVDTVAIILCTPSRCVSFKLGQ